MLVFAAAVGLLSLEGRDAHGPLGSASFGRGTTVVLVHGLGSRPEHWLPTARLLARHHHVVMLELPGHGDGDLPQTFSLDVATEALDAAIREAAHGPVVLVGHSVGGLVAANEALAHPERVRRLVLVETALKPQAEGAEREAMLHQLDTDYRGLLGSAYRAFGRDSAQGEELLAYAATLDSARMTRWIRLALTTDLSVPVAALRTPTLAVLAERSWPLGEPWSLTRDALGYTAAPNVEPLRVMNSGHFVMLDQPAALAAAIERFTAQPAFDLVAQR